jgi:hypothetical protein
VQRAAAYVLSIKNKNRAAGKPTRAEREEGAAVPLARE